MTRDHFRKTDAPRGSSLSLPDTIPFDYGLIGRVSDNYGSIGRESWLTSQSKHCDLGPYSGYGTRSESCQDRFTETRSKFELVLDAYTSAVSRLGEWMTSAVSQLGQWMTSVLTTRHGESFDVKEPGQPPILIKESPDMFRKSSAEPPCCRPSRHEHDQGHEQKDVFAKTAELPYVGSGGVTTGGMDAPLGPHYQPYQPYSYF